MPAIFGRGITALYQIQSAFATFPGGGDWIPLSAYEHSDGETRGREVDPLLGRGFFNKRDPVSSAPVLPQGGGQKQVPVCMREIGYWLCATFGAPVTTGVNPYTHVWESGKDVIQSLAQSKKLTNALWRRSRGLMVNTLAFNLAKESGYPRATLGMMLRDEVKSLAEVTGSILPAMTLLRATAATPFVMRNAVAAPVTAFTFNYSNQLERFDPLNGTEYPDALDPGDSLVSGSFTVRYEDATYDDLADAGTAQPWSFGWLLPNGLGVGVPSSINFDLNGVLFDRAPLPITGPGRLLATYSFQCEQSAIDPAVTVTVINDVEGYPPPP